MACDATMRARIAACPDSTTLDSAFSQATEPLLSACTSHAEPTGNVRCSRSSCQISRSALGWFLLCMATFSGVASGLETSLEVRSLVDCRPRTRRPSDLARRRHRHVCRCFHSIPPIILRAVRACSSRSQSQQGKNRMCFRPHQPSISQNWAAPSERDMEEASSRLLAGALNSTR